MRCCRDDDGRHRRRHERGRGRMPVVRTEKLPIRAARTSSASARRSATGRWRRLQPRGSDQDRHRGQRARPQHADLRGRRHRRASRRSPTAGARGSAPGVRGPGAGHRGHRAGAEGRLHDRQRARPRAGRGQAAVERVRDRLARRARARASRSRDGREHAQPALHRCVARDGREPGRRRRAARPATWPGRLGFDETDDGQVALVGRPRWPRTSLKHAGRRRGARWRAGGDRRSRDARARPRSRHGRRRPLPRGRLLHRGHPGTGLGAIRRLATRFDIYSRPGTGTAVLIRGRVDRDAAAERARFEVGAVVRAGAGETVCGDAWAARQPRGTASPCWSSTGSATAPAPPTPPRAAVQAFRRASPGAPPAARLTALHEALRATRGAAVAVADVDAPAGWCASPAWATSPPRSYGAGPAQTWSPTTARPGTTPPGSQRVQLPVARATPLLVMHSDGLGLAGDLDAIRACCSAIPALVAGVLYRDFARGRDDATRRRRAGSVVVKLDVLSVNIGREHDVVNARQRARQVAELLGFDVQDQTRIATAVSEIARNAFRYAGGGRVEFAVEGRSAPQLLVDRGAATRAPASPSCRPSSAAVPLAHRHGLGLIGAHAADGCASRSRRRRPGGHRGHACARCSRRRGAPLDAGERRRDRRGAGSRRARRSRWPRCSSRTRSCCGPWRSCGTARRSWSGSTASSRTPTAAWSRSTPSWTRRPITCAAPTS